MKRSILARIRLMIGLAAASVSLAGCVNVRYEEEHSALDVRMLAVATRFSRTMSQQGMAGVTTDIEDCYRESTLVLVKRFALQDCLAYDYAAYSLDRDMARKFLYRRGRNPYFVDGVASARWTKYGKLDGFGSPAELSAYLTPTKQMIFQTLNTPGYVMWNPSRPRPPLLNANGFF